ncbi:MAG TPA: nitroreductase family protein [Salinibacter sp.]|nr:nitroreductase family protein [Salinibacter sp.]
MESLSATDDRKTAAPDHDILDIFAERWSPRAFSDQRVEPEKIRRMLEAARWTMSSYNEQPWRYIVASRHDDPETYETVLRCLAEGNQAWAQNAPVLMLGVYKKTFSRNDTSNRAGPHDLGAASAALTFQATAMDLYVHQMAGIKQEVIRETFDVPSDFEPMTGLAVGYLGAPEQLSEKMQASERSPRSRKSLRDFAFGSTWDSPTSIVVDE